MKTLTKALVGTIAAGAMVIPAASPAFAHDGRDRGGISAGEIIAGAIVIGGIAAVAGASSRNNSRDYDYGRAGYGDRDWGDRDGRSYGWDRGQAYANPRQAVQLCVSAAQRYANRYSYGQARVTDIRDIDRNDRGYTIRGRIAVNDQGRDWQRGDRDYGRGWNGDYRGYNNDLRGYDSGTFKCRVEYGRVTNLDFDGLRGL